MNRSTEPTAQSRTNPTLSATRAATLAIRPWNRYQNLSLPRKFSLLLIALLIPLIVLSVAYGYDRWQAYTAAKLESAGIPHLVTLRQLLELLPAHRLLTRDTMEGRPDAQGQLAEVRQSIEAAIAHLDENPGNRALALGGHQHWQEFKARWSGLVQAGGAKGLPEIIATHDLLINSTTSMLDVVGERSGLILDSKVETFRLVNLVINQLPLVMEKTTQLRRTALGLNKLGESSELERILLTTLQNETAQTLIRMRANIESALASDPDLRPRIENEFRALEHAVDLFQSRLRETYESDARNRLSHAEVTRLSNDVLDRNFEVYDAALSSLTLALEGRIASNRNLMIVKAIAILFGLSLIMVAFNHMSRSVVGRLRHIREVFTNLSNGQFNNRITIAIQDEIGEVLQALAAMQAKLGADRSQLQRRAIEIGRLKSALDSASAGILVTDKDYKVTYANPAFQRTMERHSSVLSRHISGFDPSRIVGMNMDAFHKHPAHQRDTANRTRGAHRNCVEIENSIFQLTTSPILDAKGDRMGAVLEWEDLTEQGAAEREIQRIVTGAVNGDLTQRLSLDGKSGFTLQLAKDINLLTESIGALVHETNETMAAIARGDLTHHVATNCEGAFGELGCNINATVQTLTDMIAKIRSSAEDVRNGSTEIAQANLDLSQRTEEQAANLQVSASNITQLTQIVRTNVETAHRVNKLASHARDNAETGGEAVRKAVTAMSQINSSSEKMEDIIGAIDELAFQTNLLALNAAVEAARAGDQGRGFAVVANEVRSLAQRSAAAAREIKDLIEDSRAKVSNGTQLVHDSGNTLEKIIASVKQVGDMIAQISSGGDEQLLSIEEASNAIRQIDNATQQNAALVEQTAAASKALGDQAQNLTELVAFFNVAHGGGTAAHAGTLALRAPAAKPPAPIVERRQANRPWSTPKPTPKAALPIQKAVGDYDAEAEWEAF